MSSKREKLRSAAAVRKRFAWFSGRTAAESAAGT
jgi:hypothetical protein